MKKSTLAILICSVLLNVALATGLILAKNSTDNYRELFAANAQSAEEHFLAYNQTGQNEEFTYAIADFNIMRQTLFLLDDTKDDDYVKTHFSELYGQLILHPEKLRPYSLDLAAVCAFLQENYADQTGADKVAELLNQIKYSE